MKCYVIEYSALEQPCHNYDVLITVGVEVPGSSVKVHGCMFISQMIPYTLRMPFEIAMLIITC